MAKKETTPDKPVNTGTEKPAENKPAKQAGCTEAAVGRIRQYLDERAKTDPLFAEVYRKPGKSIEGCMGFICDKVRQSRKTMLTDDEVFGMAVHYYDEDNIPDSKMPSGVKIMCTAPDSHEAKPRRKSPAKQSAKHVTTQPSAQLSLFD